MHSICRGFWFFQGHTWMCPHTLSVSLSHKRIYTVYLLRSLTLVSYSIYLTHTPLLFLSLSLRPEERLGRCLVLAWQCREGHKGEWVLIEFAQLQPQLPMGLQTILQDSHSRPRAQTHIHLKSSQLLHTQFNQGLCLWKWAYVTSSVSLLSSPSASLSINVSLCLSHGFLLPFLSDCLSALIHFSLLAKYIAVHYTFNTRKALLKCICAMTF